MAVIMNFRWDDAGTIIPVGQAKYVVNEQPIAEYDNWALYTLADDIQSVIDDVINKFNANTILKADTDDTPVALAVGTNTIVGRAAGNISALTASETRTLLNVEDGSTADQTGAEIKSAYEAEANAYTDTKNTKLSGIETSADVTDSTNVNAAGAVMESDFDATTFLYATADNTPQPKTPAEVRTVLSVSSVKNAVVKAIADDDALYVADGITHFTVPIELNGMNLVSVGAHVYTASTSGTPTFQIHNLTDTVDMLSTRITIDANEKDSSTAASAAVIDGAHDDVATGDVIRLDCDVVGTGTAGMEIRMGFE